MTCLLELHKRGLGGLVFDAILISLPAAPTPAEWLKMRQVTSRRLVNAYSYVFNDVSNIAEADPFLLLSLVPMIGC